MKILIEAHHPAHIHFWKYPVRELQSRGHQVLMIGRDRDVMRRLLEVYDWIDAEIPPRRTGKNRFPMAEMFQRQWAVARAIRRFKPDVVASLMGSYTQSAKLFGVRNIVFTDSEHQVFNHRIAHPFADEIHTPECFYKQLGKKQRRYRSIHELAFLDSRYYQPDERLLERYGLDFGAYMVIRLSAWNTLHDRKQRGIGARIYDFIEAHKSDKRIILIAEEGAVPPGLEAYAASIQPQDFHCILAFSGFVLSEGASTASESSCLGTPTVYINSIERMGYLRLLETESDRLRCFDDPTAGLAVASEWLRQIEEATDLANFENREVFRKQFSQKHVDLVSYVIQQLEESDF